MNMETSVEAKPVFLLGSHKSGSSLLRSLLDGHAQLAVLPKETHLFQFTNQWVDYKLRANRPTLMGAGQMVERLITQLIEDASQPDPYGDAPDFAGYDEALLRRRLEGVEVEDQAAFYMQIMRAIYEATLGEPPPANVALVEKSVEHAEFAYVLAQLYPSARFIHIVRNPYATLVAIRRAKQRKKSRYPYMGSIAQALSNSFGHLFKNRIALPRYMCIRFEDLLVDTEATMRGVAGFLKIDYAESLTQPTSMGEAWGGNSTRDESFAGISRKPLNAWSEQIEPFEIALANAIAGPIFDAFGYEKLEAEHPYRPNRHERLRTYVANRMFLRAGAR